MAITYNTSIVKDGLILHLDPANRKSYIGASKPPILSGKAWVIGSGGTTNFSQNGSTDENERILATDPWGNQSVVWETRANGTNADDGGWTSTYVPIDCTKLYRFSVWVKRTSATSAGTFYFGTGAGGQEVIDTATNITRGNPYWDCASTGALTQDVWYLVCGHVYPHDTAYTGQHPNTGYYTIANGIAKVKAINACNIGTELKWGPASVTATHRAYHYYCADATTRLQFAFPRIDLCDGTEPSIKEMLYNGESDWKDLSGKNNNHVIVANPIITNSAFNVTTSNYFTRSGALSGVESTGTVVIWYKTNDQTELWVRGNTNGAFYLAAADSSGSYYHSNVGTPINYIDTVVQTTPQAFRNNTWHMWEAKNVNFASWTAFDWFGYTGAWQITADVGCIMVYNKNLTDAESKRNFNAMGGRYSI